MFFLCQHHHLTFSLCLFPLSLGCPDLISCDCDLLFTPPQCVCVCEVCVCEFMSLFMRVSNVYVCVSINVVSHIQIKQEHMIISCHQQLIEKWLRSLHLRWLEAFCSPFALVTVEMFLKSLLWLSFLGDAEVERVARMMTRYRGRLFLALVQFHTHLHCLLWPETGSSSCSESVAMATSMRSHTHVSKWMYLQMFRVYASAVSGTLLGPRFSRSGASIKESRRKQTGNDYMVRNVVQPVIN